MLFNCRRRRHSLSFVYFYTLVLAVFVTTGIVIWKFQDECFHFPIPPSEEHFRKCANGNYKSRRNLGSKYGPLSISDTSNIYLNQKSNEKLLYRNSRTAKEDKSNTNVVEKKEQFQSESSKQPVKEKIETNVLQINERFENRTKESEIACSKYFYDEDSINFDTTNDADFLSEMKKLENLERGENKVFMKTTHNKRTKWIFFTHKRKKVEIQWCPIYKAASTPWFAIFTKLAGALTQQTSAKIHSGKITFLNLAKDFRLLKPPTQLNSARNAIPRYSMIVVRHPFKRILSAYQDKIERVKGREYYHRMYGKKIIRNFRINDKALNKLRKGQNLPAWYEMALNIQHQYKDKGSMYQEIDATLNNQSIHKEVQDFSKKESQIKNSTNKIMDLGNLFVNAKAPDTPTFLEFCRYLLAVDPRIMDEHWRPQHLDCSPCHHKFDLFLKVESMEQDKLAVFKALGYENTTSLEYLELEQTWKAWTNPSGRLHNETYYFSQLSESMIQNLYNLYELDFELFGYSPDKYLDMIKT